MANHTKRNQMASSNFNGFPCWLSMVTLVFILVISTSSIDCVTRSGRPQRQAVLDELATGLTGTGTSFNSYGRSSWQQQQQTTGYDDIPDLPGKYPDRGGYPTGGYGGYGSGIDGPRTGYGSAYGGYGTGLDGGRGYGGGAGNSWRGFGGGYGGGYGKGKGGMGYPSGYPNYNRNRFGTKY